MFVGTNFGTRLDGGKVKTQMILGGSLTQVAFPLLFFGYFNNLLTRWGLLEHDTGIARWMRAIAWLVCVASLIVAFWSELQPPRDQPVVIPP